MSTVSSLVVRRKLATMRQVEEALARQVLYGGDVVTNLLEVAPPPATDESQLSDILAEALGIGAAPIEAMRAPDASAVARVPRAIAEEHGFVPLAFRENALVIALSEPLAPATERSLAQSLGIALVQVASPLARVRQAMERAYGVTMDRRSRWLIARLDGDEREQRRSSAAPPRLSIDSVHNAELSQSGGAESARVRTSIPLLPDDPLSAEALAKTVRRSQPSPTTRNAATPAAKTGSAGATVRSSQPGPEGLGWFLRNAKKRAAPPSVASVPAVAEGAPTQERRRGGRPSSPSRPSSPQRRRRGPFTRKEAEGALEAATDREAVLTVVLDFAAQYFSYCALFLVHDDLAEGWDARGDGAPPDQVRKMGVPLDMPSILRTARTLNAPASRNGAAHGLDAVIATDLDRSADSDVAVAPVLVGKRVVGLLYGDDGDAPIKMADLGDVFLVTTMAGTALAKIIVARKKKANPAPAQASPPTPSEDASQQRTEDASQQRTEDASQQRTEDASQQRTEDAPQRAVEAFEPVPEAPKSATLRPFHTLSTRPIVAAVGSPRPVGSEKRRATDPYGFPAVSTPTPSWTENPAHVARITLRQIPAMRPSDSAPPPASGGSSAVVAPANMDDLGTPIVAGSGVADWDVTDAPGQAAPPRRPPPSLLGHRALGSPLPREEADDPVDTVTRAPELESAEVKDEELEDLFSEDEGNRVEAYPARPPPAPKVVGADEPRKVIVALDPDHVSKVDDLLRGGREGERASAALQSLGVAALPAIMDRFPGPVRVDRSLPAAKLPPVGDAGPLLGVIARLGRRALREVLARVGDVSVDARFWATYLLSEIIDPETASSLVYRLVDDEDAVRGVAAIAARALLENHRQVVSTIVEPLANVLLDSAAHATLRGRAAQALGQLREAEGVEALILQLGSSDPALSVECHDALVAITCQNPRKQGSTWTAWFTDNRGRPRLAWLIDALIDDELALREAASAELKTITKVYFGYYPDGTKVERERAYRRYLAWWNEVGLAQFGDR